MIFPLTIDHVLQQAVIQLSLSDSPRLDAEILLAYALGRNRTWLIIHAQEYLNEEVVSKFQHLVTERAKGIPIAYLIHSREFWSLNFYVNEQVLIPRPESELLVENVLEYYSSPKIKKLTENNVNHQTITIADLGTGSGAIALAIANERPFWHVFATDKVLGALNIARHNANRLGIKNVSFALGNWCEALPSDTLFDAIVSNPPYIAPHDPHLSSTDIRYEPITALIAEENGLADINIIISQAWARLKPNGTLWLEHGYDQVEKVKAIFQKIGYKEIISYFDLNQHSRITMAKKI